MGTPKHSEHVGRRDAVLRVAANEHERVGKPRRGVGDRLCGFSCHDSRGIHLSHDLTLRRGAVHHAGERLRRDAADAPRVWVDAREHRAGAPAQDHVVVEAQNRDFARNLDSRPAADVDKLPGPQIAWAEDSYGFRERAQPFLERFRAARKTDRLGDHGRVVELVPADAAPVVHGALEPLVPEPPRK